MKCPLDMLKTRLQSTTAKVSMSAMLLDIWRREGVRGLWTGYGATLVRDLPYLIIKWVTYTNMQTLLAGLGRQVPVPRQRSEPSRGCHRRRDRRHRRHPGRRLQDSTAGRTHGPRAEARDDPADRARRRARGRRARTLLRPR